MSAEAFEWTATLLSLVGALMLATNMKGARWAWPVYLVANVCWVGFALSLDNVAWGLILTQLGFTITSLIGIYRCFVKPLISKVSIYYC